MKGYICNVGCKHGKFHENSKITLKNTKKSLQHPGLLIKWHRQSLKKVLE